MNIKALFFDIDGTLVPFGTQSVLPSTVEALEQVRSQGIRLFIATGRPKAIINNLGALQERQLIDGYITMNGAYCFIGDQVIFKSPIPANEAWAIGQFCAERTASCIFVSEEQMVVYNPTQTVKDIFYHDLRVLPLPSASLAQATAYPVLQITPFINAADENLLAPQVPNCEISRWHPAFTDITAIGNTKQQGVDLMLQAFGLSLHETMAFGDGGNDMGMLQHVHFGIAMGQASDAVKSCARFVTLPAHEGGIAHALKTLHII